MVRFTPADDHCGFSASAVLATGARRPRCFQVWLGSLFRPDCAIAISRTLRLVRRRSARTLSVVCGEDQGPRNRNALKAAMNRSLRFCMITTFYPPYNFGGDGIFVYRLSNALAKLGHHVEVVHCQDSYLLLAD